LKGFGSDNHSGVHPNLLQAIIDSNPDHAPSYGTDSYSEKAIQAFQEIFNFPVDVFFVFNGTAANVVSMRAAAKPFQSIICSDIAHLNVDECGAPEYMSGAKLIPIPNENGKIKCSDIEKQLIRLGDQHFSQPRVLSLTQPTELGTCYSLDEFKQLVEFAHKKNLLVHVDGSRLANAVVSLNTSFKEMITDNKIDILSFGGTKNGLMMGEAIVVFNKSLAQDMKFLRKQSCQLPSKTRFIAAQFEVYLRSGLWKEIASHALKMAELLKQQCLDLKNVKITQPRQSNAVFAKIPQPWVKVLKNKHFFYVWDESTFECRWMTSWDTQPEEIKAFVASMKELEQ
jgi:threonine aldolase